MSVLIPQLPRTLTRFRGAPKMSPDYARELALDDLEGMVTSYLWGQRGWKIGPSLGSIAGQLSRARRSGASEEVIKARIIQGIAALRFPNKVRKDEVIDLFFSSRKPPLTRAERAVARAKRDAKLGRVIRRGRQPGTPPPRLESQWD
jgi:hypothetical protein